MSGSSFNGLLEEVPGVGLDRFNNGASVFLLTHCHADHLVGLENINFSGTIYCSQITKDLLKLKSKYSHNLNYVRALDLDQNYELFVGGQVVTLTLISANHCPGAVMFLVETEAGKSVLCTGDLRAEKWWLESLKNNNPYLLPYTSKLKQRQLDNIYLDTTFGYRGEPFIEMLNNNDGINIAILLLKSYPMDDPEVCFFFKDFILGFELAWLSICKSFDSKLHLSEALKSRLKVLGGAYQEIIAKDNENCLFHACEFNCTCYKESSPLFHVLIRQCINFNAVDFAGAFCPILLDNIEDEEMEKDLTLLAVTKKGNKIYQFRKRKWILPKGQNELLSNEIKLIFSRHSSYMECCDFVKCFEPKQVYPCVDSKESWKLGVQMSRLFGKYCNSKQPSMPLEFKYDTMKLIDWGLPSNEVRERPVKIINRWNFLDSQREIGIVADYLKSAKKDNGSAFTLNIRGQHWTSQFRDPHYSEDDRKCDLARRKDYHLQNIVIGRGERAYKTIIQDLQKLYRNLDVDKGKGFEYQKDFDEDALYEEAAAYSTIKLGGLDGYNYDRESNSIGESFGNVPSSEIEKVETDIETDIDEGEEDEDDKETLGVPSQLIEVGDYLVLKRLSSAALDDEDTQGHKRQSTGAPNSMKFSFLVLVSEDHYKKDSSSLRFESEFVPEEEIKTEKEIPLRKEVTDSDEAISTVSITLQANPMSWLGMGLKSVYPEKGRRSPD